MAELKKCPFCGGEALYRHLDDKWAVRCRYCNAQTFGYTTQDEAVEAWNNRPTESEIRAKAIDEFAEKLGILCENSAMALDRYNGRPLYNKDGKWHDFINEVAEQLKERE